MSVLVIGAGLAGAEAAWQCAERGVEVTLVDMKPAERTPAHTGSGFAELCCSNSFRGAAIYNAVGLLKEELRRLGSLIISSADSTAVPAGGALAVDREAFSALVTERLRAHPNIRIESSHVDKIPRGRRVIVATGPLTDGALAQDIAELTGSGYLNFYDASAPLVSADSVDMSSAFAASRYGKGDADYVNCPLSEGEYKAFVSALATAEQAPVHGFEDKLVFEGCMPVEVMARRGFDTLRFGPLKPVGLTDPKTGRQPYAAVQLRKDNAAGGVYNMVGFQTHLRFPEQKRVFGMIPALANAEFLRYGVMHRNSFLDSPRLLDGYYRLRADPLISFAGQFTGVEGYVESAASGLYAGIAAAVEARTGALPPPLPPRCAVGALAAYVSNPAVESFQPMNINFGIISGDGITAKGKRGRLDAIAARALETVSGWPCAARH